MSGITNYGGTPYRTTADIFVKGSASGAGSTGSAGASGSTGSTGSAGSTYEPTYDGGILANIRVCACQGDESIDSTIFINKPNPDGGSTRQYTANLTDGTTDSTNMVNYDADGYRID